MSIFFGLLCFVFSNEVFRLMELLSFFAPGVDENGKSHRYAFYDDHIIVTYSSDKTYLRLCYLNGPSKGGMLSKNVIPFDNFRVDIRFSLIKPEEKSYGNGIAFWVTKENEFISGDCYGRNEKFSGCLVVLDTSPVSKTAGVSSPYIGVACGNELNYDVSSKGANIIKSPVQLKPTIFNSKCILRIENIDNNLKVSLSYKDNGFQEIYKISNSGITKDCKFGISAMNSFNNFEYRIIGIRTYSAEKIAKTHTTGEQHEPKKGSKYVWLIFAVVIVAIGYYLYRKGERLNKD
ncbi:hypothetical protein CWI37_0394p0010 [Hamiltosporidium tvaerminnensis]|uniref:L-type lectin-like domain-containing protein n=1 Tax=Hamiltosporidium tvaerminnensis TaxID=1176355 RepID=A0A4Q9L864_9MICR|nr:Vesicular integral-membrane protein VIP36 [Hamiltosporidium tvaerminnensis]TBU02900.1 hypothetical protein CWI37_0394p0010 [Hamiltosporidium tvaerminnensis]